MPITVWTAERLMQELHEMKKLPSPWACFQIWRQGYRNYDDEARNIITDHAKVAHILGVIQHSPATE